VIVSTQLKVGTLVLYNGKPHRVATVMHRTPGNLRGFVQAKLVNIENGSNQEVRFATDDKLERAILDEHKLQFSYKAGDTYYVTYVPSDSGHAISGTVIIAGGVWTYPGQQHNLGQTIYFRTVDIFDDADNIDFREEFSNDNQNWTLMSKGHETRVRK